MTGVSIIVPYRNREAYLDRTLLSISQQQYRPLEVLLVDNGSTDHSAQLAQRFQQNFDGEDFRVVLLSESTPGAAAARNAGLRRATHPYVYFFDSDDEMSPDFLSSAMRLMTEKQLDLVAAPTLMVLPDGQKKERRYGYSCHPANQILTGMLSTQSMLIRTRFLREQDGWNEDLPYWNDWELGLRLMLASPRMQWLRGKAYHRIYLHPDSITGSSYAQSFDKMKIALLAAQSLVRFLPKGRRGPCLAALAFREGIMAGILQCEGRNDYAAECLAMGLSMSTTKTLRRATLLFYRYSSMGLRGAWRVAIRLCHYF
ncbi:MAG: glycosyltransferase family 2 protein [Bacteroidaceae bacterium]|nr:glycosyltransferase family 2 protein [Bacteroidaceae bacterium]